MESCYVAIDIMDPNAGTKSLVQRAKLNFNGDKFTLNTPEEYAKQICAEAQIIISYLLGLCPSTNQGILPWGVDSREEEKESPEDPYPDHS